MKSTRELLTDVLDGKEVDRVPVAPFFFNNFIHKYYKEANPFNLCEKDNTVDAVVKGIELYEKFGFDIILRTANIWESLNKIYCDSENWIVNENKIGNELQWEIKTTIKTPEKVLTQLTKFARNTNFEVVHAINEFYIKDESDFDVDGYLTLYIHQVEDKFYLQFNCNKLSITISSDIAFTYKVSFVRVEEHSTTNANKSITSSGA